MGWVCNNCGRTFKHINQTHSCVKINPEDFFAGKSPVVQSIYDNLKEKITSFGEIKIHASRSAINFSGSATFMVVRPKKEWLEIEFLLDEEYSKPPVYSSFHYLKNRFALKARLENETSINKTLLGLLKKAYKLSI